MKLRPVFLALCAMLALWLAAAPACAGTPFQLVPLPARVSAGQGMFTFDAKTRVTVPRYEGDSIAHVFQRFARSFGQATGIEFTHARIARRARLQLRIDPSLPAEGYRLHVDKRRIEIEASRPAGFHYALLTLKQLMPRNVMAGVAVVPARKWQVPAVDIEDAPRYGWRGFMLDEGRHFFGKETVKRVLDMMETYKLNRFHWHLTEDQGWRIEIKKYPRLTEVGAWRDSRALGWGDSLPDGRRYGGYYTQEDIREIVAYARERFIEIIPEVDLPGHSQAAVAAYPEFLACDPQKKHEVWLYQGISDDVINVAHPRAVQFAKDVVDELAALFPFGYIHLGGDECPTRKWKENAECRALLKQIGSTNYRDLQIHFYKQLADHLAAKPAAQRRKLVFWNEVLHGNTTPLGNGITIMAWTGADEAALEAARRGLDNILTPQIPYYINRRQAPGPDEPMSQGNGTETVEAVYNYQPQKDVPANLARHYKGVQANFWTEWVIEPSVLEYLMLPRLAAVAEAAWTPQVRRNYQDFVQRIRPDARLYELKEWNYGKHIMH